MISLGAAESADPQSLSKNGVRLKSDAPASVRRWFDAQEKFRKKRADEFFRLAKFSREEGVRIRGLVEDIRKGQRPNAMTIVMSDRRLDEYRRELENDAKSEDEDAANWEVRAQVILSDYTCFNTGSLPSESEVGEVGTVDTVNVISVAGPTDIVAKYMGEVVWIHGVDASDAIDDHFLALKAMFAVTGTRSYETAAGSVKTVHLIEPCDPKAYLEIIDKSRPDLTSHPSTAPSIRKE